jgi:hypothetical protein
VIISLLGDTRSLAYHGTEEARGICEAVWLFGACLCYRSSAYVLIVSFITRTKLSVRAALRPVVFL